MAAAAAALAASYDHLVRVMLIGDSGVGKTSLVSRACGDPFSPKHLATIGVDFKCHRMVLDGSAVKVQVFDTAGQERFRVLTKTYYRSANSFVVVFDITSAASFVAIRDWVGEVRAHASADAHLVLVGNKCDSAEAREVTEDEAKELARELGCEYMETSAIGSPDGEEPMEPFRAAARLAVAGLSSEPEPDCNAPVDVSAPRTSAFPCCAI